MITKVSKNNSNKSNNEYYNLESIFEEFIIQSRHFLKGKSFG